MISGDDAFGDPSESMGCLPSEQARRIQTCTSLAWVHCSNLTLDMLQPLRIFYIEKGFETSLSIMVHSRQHINLMGLVLLTNAPLRRSEG